MKQLFIFLLCSTILLGCSSEVVIDGVTPSLDYFSIDSYHKELLFHSDGTLLASDNVHLWSKNGSWSFIDVPDWISITPMSGNSSAEIVIKAIPNESSLERNAKCLVAFKGNNISKNDSILVSQSGSKRYLTFPEEYELISESSSYSGWFMEMSAMKQSLKIPINTNIPDIYIYNLDYLSGETTWATASYDNNQQLLTVNLESNKTRSIRTARVYLGIKSEGKSWSHLWYLEICQYPEGLCLIDDFITNTTYIDKEGGVVKCKIYSDSPWTAVLTGDYSTDPEPDWIQISPTTGNEGLYDVEISVLPNNEANERSCGVDFYIGETKQAEIDIIQK